MSINLSELKPKLLRHERIIGNNNVIVENTATKEQIMLPLDAMDFLDFFDGEHSINRTLSLVYEVTGKIYFESVFKALKKLKEIDLLEDFEGDLGSEEDISPHQIPPSLMIRPFKEFNIKKKLGLGIQKPTMMLLFVLLFLGITYIGANEVFPKLKFSGFLKTGNHYENAVLTYVLVVSLLMSLRGLFKVLFQYLATSALYGLHFRINLLSVSLDIKDNAIFSLPKKLYALAYYLGISLIYLVLAILFYQTDPGSSLSNDVLLIAILLTFNHLDPFRNGDLTSAFQFLYSENQLESLTPYLKNNTLAGLFRKATGSKEEIRYALYTSLAIGWAVLFLLFSVNLAAENFPRLLMELQFGGITSQLNAGLIFLLLGFNLFYLLYDLFTTIVKGFLSYLYRKISKKVDRSEKIRIDEEQSKVLLNAFEDDTFFQVLMLNTRKLILKKSLFKKMPAGAVLINQGVKIDKLFFLLEGILSIQVEDPDTGQVKRIAELHAPCVFGESSLFDGDSKTTATVEAIKDLKYLEIDAKFMQKLHHEKEHTRGYGMFIERVKLSQMLSNASLFTDFPKEVMNLFIAQGKTKNVKEGREIIKQGQDDKTFYILINGAVDIIKDNEKVAELKSGDYFGEVALLANTTRTATVKATEPSMLLAIDSDSFWEILLENIELGMFLESVSQRRMGPKAALAINGNEADELDEDDQWEEVEAFIEEEELPELPTEEEKKEDDHE